MMKMAKWQIMQGIRLLRCSHRVIKKIGEENGIEIRRQMSLMS
jgi:hypothetical protein